MQLEQGENGTKHYQGCVHFQNAINISSVRTIFGGRAHWEFQKQPGGSNKRKVSEYDERAFAYCSKSDTRIDGPWYIGPPPINKEVKVLATSDLYGWQKTVLGIIESAVDDRCIHWIYEQQGNVGKSALVKKLVVEHGALVIGGKASDSKFAVAARVTSSGTDGMRLCVVDIPRSLEKYVSYQGLEEIKNGCFFSNKYESAQCVYNCGHVIVFANFPPEREKLSDDRWRVWMIVEKQLVLEEDHLYKRLL